MRPDFETLAKEIEKELEARFTKEQLKDDYIYKELNRIVKEWRAGDLTSKKTDIGIAAIKLFDSDDILARNISTLSAIFRRKAIMDGINQKKLNKI